MTRSQLRVGLLLSALIAAVSGWFTLPISPWITVCIFLATLTIYHLVICSRFILPFPHLAVLVSALQYVLAAWLGLYVPGSGPIAQTGPQLAGYLQYGGPVFVAFFLGWLVSMAKLPAVLSPVTETGPKLLFELDVLLVIGLAAAPFGKWLDSRELAFLFVLIANLRYVGVFGRMICRAPGWQWRTAVVLGFEVLFAADTAMFHPLLLWGMWTFAVCLHVFRPRARVLAVLFVCAAIALPSLQEAKWRLRGSFMEVESGLIEQQDLTEASQFEKVFGWLGYMAEAVAHTVKLEFNEEFLSDTISRFNQGWIISRVMTYVPDVEPFAHGQTIVDALRSVVTVRFLGGEKAAAGGQENMLRFAGVQLFGQTSMNLGYAGEMYANFGQFGGIIACGLYALFFGFLFRLICKRAITSPLWWCVLPYLFFAGLKAEDGIQEVLNWTAKSVLIFAAVWIIFPGIRRALSRVTVTPRDGVSLAAESN